MGRFDPLVSDDPRQSSRALAVYRNHIDFAMPLLRKTQPRDIPQDSGRFAVFLEWRRSPYAEFALRNVVHFLGKEWGLQLFVPASIRSWVQDIVKGWRHVDVPVVPDKAHRAAESDFRSIAKLPMFWDLVKGDEQLFFNSEAMLCRSDVGDFLEYDYIGAPWPEDVISPWCRVGNGGLSLRRKSVMLEICTTCNINPIVIGPEDAYFSINLHLAGAKYRLPSPHVAAQFAVERIFSPAPLGMHRPWKFIGASELTKILRDVRY